MKIYLIYQSENTGYDSYDSAVVYAESEDDARKTYPSKYIPEGWPSYSESDGDTRLVHDWVYDWTKVSARYLGEAAPNEAAGIICASFNAG